jgi:hypothetical protein
VETRLQKLSELQLKMYTKEFSAKILLDSLVEEMKKSCRNKRNIVIIGESGHVLKVQEVNANQTRGEIRTIESTEHRMRVYHIVSTREFVKKSEHYIQFRIMNTEFNKIVTTQAILSGINGGVGKLCIEPSGNECKIIFSLVNDGGSFGKITIHTSTTSEDVKVYHMPKRKIEISYLLTYLKRSQNMLNFPTDYVTVYVSEKGLILHTDMKDGLCTVLYTHDVSTIDLTSYA